MTGAERTKGSFTKAWKSETAQIFVGVSSGEVTPGQKMIYGSLYQKSFANRIRNKANVPMIAVRANR